MIKRSPHYTLLLIGCDVLASDPDHGQHDTVRTAVSCVDQVVMASLRALLPTVERKNGRAIYCACSLVYFPNISFFFCSITSVLRGLGADV